MSKIGKKLIVIPEGVTVTVKEEAVEVKGPNATLAVPILEGVSVAVAANGVNLSTLKNSKQVKSNWGTLRALVQNAVEGATGNFTKTLLIEGVGYRAALEDKELIMALGYSHPVKFTVPEGIEIEVQGTNVIKITGADKAGVGQAAATIRGFRKPEPYKGKGIRYEDEVVKRKSGKKAASTTT